MRSQPDFIETALPQALMPEADFLFVNVTHRFDQAERRIKCYMISSLQKSRT